MTTLLPTPPAQPYADDVLTGGSSAVQRLRLQITRIAPHFRIAILTGEPGVGKQTVARQMHRLTSTASRPFVVISSAEFAQHGLPPDTRGTIYLTGLESLTRTAQNGLLHALKSLHRDTRVVIGTRSDLKAMVAAGRLLPDLYAAIGTVEIRVPTLRDRLPDLDLIVPAMLRRLSGDAEISPFAQHRLQRYHWPGNLEELWSLCQSLAPTASTITEADLPPLVSVATEPLPHAAPRRGYAPPRRRRPTILLRQQAPRSGTPRHQPLHPLPHVKHSNSKLHLADLVRPFVAASPR